MKKLLLAGSLAMGLCQAQAVEWLAWMVDGAEQEFKYATLVVYKDGEKLMTDGWETWVRDPETGRDQIAYPDATGHSTESAKYYADISSWQGAAYSFQLELLNESWEILNPDALIVSYEALSTARFDNERGIPENQTWNAIGPAPVPEPTGGTLALLGLALLGLKRKRFKTVDAMT